MDLDAPLNHLVGIGPTTAAKLELLGLHTVWDLINHYPFRYDDFSKSAQLTEVKVGEVVTLTGEIWLIKNVYTRSRKVLTRATFNDGTSSLELIWFNQAWLEKSLPSGTRVQISGKVGKKGTKLSITQPVWEQISPTQQSVISQQTLHTGRLVPIYPETYGLNSKWIRSKIHTLFPQVENHITDPLPKMVQQTMLDLVTSLKQIHFPDDWELLQKAQDRLSFDELFYIQLFTQYQRQQWRQKAVTNPWEIDQKKLAKFIHTLPFHLTNAQQKAINEIIEDLQSSSPMNRLLQGEVGSGKTVVAAAIIYLAYLNGLKTYLMAPTEILAFQHHQTLIKLLESSGIKIGIYTGSRKKIAEDVIVGTHALLSDKMAIQRVGLVIIDEQQRFGVEQRSKLRDKVKLPHFLTMTATPIPRTVALTLYGDLDQSIIDELPKGRKLVKTYFVPEKKRRDAYRFIRDHVQVGEQVYIITPLIEESETSQSAKAAKVEFERLQRQVFPDLKIGLLHGRLNSTEKAKVLGQYQNGKLQILVSTSVVEVGVDIPNATIMMVEGAERFGLAQLHQLRGRVGRSQLQSYCLLFTEDKNPESISRVKNLERIHDGLKLAELDLTIRGAGDIHGIRQSGRWNLKIASLSDPKLIESSRSAALKILQQSPNLDKYPALKAKLASGFKDVSPD